MKSLLFALLLVSLAGNVYLVRDRFSAESHSPSATDVSSVARASASEAAPAYSQADWEKLQQGDPASLKQLSALGISDKLMRRMVRNEIAARYRVRFKEVTDASADRRYWRSSYSRDGWVPSAYAKTLDIQREMQAEITRVLGADADADDNRGARFASFLPAEKVAALVLIDEDYQAMQMQFQQQNGMWLNLPSDKEKERLLAKQKKEDLAALLTPAELEAYELRQSSTSSSLRYQLALLDVSEEEFGALFKVSRDYEKQIGAEESGAQFFGIDTEPKNDATKQALAAKTAQMKQILGEERYAEYERSQNYEYRTIAALTEKLALPKDKAVAAYELKQSIEKRLNEFRPTPGATSVADQRLAMQATLLKEAETGFTAILGEKGYQTYRDYGYVFRRLTPPPPPPPKK